MPDLSVVIYAAKSTEDVRGSIGSQVTDCTLAIEREGSRVVRGTFSDEAASAYKGNRGAGLADAKAAAVEAASAHGSAELWVQHSDRLARGDGVSADHMAEVYFAMRKVGVRLRSVQDDGNLDDAIRAVLVGERNFEDSARKAAAIRSGKDRQMQRGERLGGPVPFGLRLIVERDAADQITSRRYEPNATQAKVVQLAFEAAGEGLGDGEVARRLNAAGHRTQHGQAWSRRRLQDLLTNHIYAGRVVRHRGKPDAEIVEATNVAPLLDPARFDQLLEARAVRDLASPAKHRRGGRSTR